MTESPPCLKSKHASLVACSEAILARAQKDRASGRLPAPGRLAATGARLLLEKGASP